MLKAQWTQYVNNFGSVIRIYKIQRSRSGKNAAEVTSKGKSMSAYEPNSKVAMAYADFTKGGACKCGRQKERLRSADAR